MMSKGDEIIHRIKKLLILGSVFANQVLMYHKMRANNAMIDRLNMRVCEYARQIVVFIQRSLCFLVLRFSSFTLKCLVHLKYDRLIFFRKSN